MQVQNSNTLLYSVWEYFIKIKNLKGTETGQVSFKQPSLLAKGNRSGQPPDLYRRQDTYCRGLENGESEKWDKTRLGFTQKQITPS